MYGQATMTRDQVFAALTQRGVVKVNIAFSGGNDEGGAEGFELLKADGSVTELLFSGAYEDYQNPGTYTVFEAGKGWPGERRPATPEEIADTLLANALEQPLYDRYGGFGGEFHVYGTLTWDVAARQVSIDGQESVETYHGFTTEV